MTSGCCDLDRAAIAGLESFASGSKMPQWVEKEEILQMAWRVGRRQAEDKARNRK